MFNNCQLILKNREIEKLKVKPPVEFEPPIPGILSYGVNLTHGQYDGQLKLPKMPLMFILP